MAGAEDEQKRRHPAHFPACPRTSRRKTDITFIGAHEIDATDLACEACSWSWEGTGAFFHFASMIWAPTGNQHGEKSRRRNRYPDRRSGSERAARAEILPLCRCGKRFNDYFHLRIVFELPSRMHKHKEHGFWVRSCCLKRRMLRFLFAGRQRVRARQTLERVRMMRRWRQTVAKLLPLRPLAWNNEVQLFFDGISPNPFYLIVLD